MTSTTTDIDNDDENNNKIATPSMTTNECITSNVHKVEGVHNTNSIMRENYKFLFTL